MIAVRRNAPQRKAHRCRMPQSCPVVRLDNWKLRCQGHNVHLGPPAVPVCSAASPPRVSQPRKEPAVEVQARQQAPMPQGNSCLPCVVDVPVVVNVFTRQGLDAMDKVLLS